jgi:hypothetical protein
METLVEERGGKALSFEFLDADCHNTYLATPWSRVLLEKVTGFQLFLKFPTFFVTRKFITSFTITGHLSLS